MPHSEDYTAEGSSPGWHIVARVARSSLHDRTWYPYWDGGCEADMFPYCGPLRLVKASVISTFEREWPKLRWKHNPEEDVWTLEGSDG